MLARTAALLLLLAMALSGCSGGGGSGGGNTTDDNTTVTPPAMPPTPPTPPAPPAPPPEPRDPVTWPVSVQDNSFDPSDLTVQVGDEVEWTHDGTAPHSVTADNGEFDSSDGLPCPGPGCMTSTIRTSFSYTFDAVGEVPYHCEVHGGMDGVVRVLALYNETPQ